MSAGAGSLQPPATDRFSYRRRNGPGRLRSAGCGAFLRNGRKRLETVPAASGSRAATDSDSFMAGGPPRPPASAYESEKRLPVRSVGHEPVTVGAKAAASCWIEREEHWPKMPMLRLGGGAA